VRIKVHPGLCMGWGQCWRWGPEVYALDDEGYLDLIVVEIPPELEEAARLGAEACPEHAITVIESAVPVSLSRAGAS